MQEPGNTSLADFSQICAFAGATILWWIALFFVLFWTGLLVLLCKLLSIGLSGRAGELPEKSDGKWAIFAFVLHALAFFGALPYVLVHFEGEEPLFWMAIAVGADVAVPAALMFLAVMVQLFVLFVKRLV